MDDDMLVSDDLMPSDADISSVYLPPVDEEATAKQRAEQAMVQSSRPVFDEVLVWLSAEITSLSSISRLELESKVPIESQVLGLQYAQAALKGVQNRLDMMKRQYLD